MDILARWKVAIEQPRTTYLDPPVGHDMALETIKELERLHEKLNEQLDKRQATLNKLEAKQDEVFKLRSENRETYLLGEIERLNERVVELYEEAAHYKDGFKELLAAQMESDWQELEAGCDGTGPIVTAHKILEVPFPDELVEYLDDDLVET